MEFQRLFIQDWLFIHPVELPGGRIAVLFVIALGFAFGRLVLLAEVAAAAFIAFQSIEAHQFAKFEKIGDAARSFNLRVDLRVAAAYQNVAPELLPQRAHLLDCGLETGSRARHAAVVPDDLAEFFVEGS